MGVECHGAAGIVSSNQCEPGGRDLWVQWLITILLGWVRLSGRDGRKFAQKGWG